jgi:hypothetical protein
MGYEYGLQLQLTRLWFKVKNSAGFRVGEKMRGSRLGYEVTSQTQAVQITAVMI